MTQEELNQLEEGDIITWEYWNDYVVPYQVLQLGVDGSALVEKIEGTWDRTTFEKAELLSDVVASLERDPL